MKKNRWLAVALILVALWLLLGNRSGEKKETAEPKKTEQTEQTQAANDTFVVPEGAVYIALPKDPEHDDFLAFDREFAAALAARETVICTRGRSPLAWADLCEMDYGTFWLKSYGYSTAWAVPEGETDKTFFYTYHMEYFDLSESDIRRMKQEIDASVSRIFALFPENADFWTKALIVHDELVRTVSYDHEKDSVYYYNPYGALCLPNESGRGILYVLRVGGSRLEQYAYRFRGGVRGLHLGRSRSQRRLRKPLCVPRFLFPEP